MNIHDLSGVRFRSPVVVLDDKGDVMELAEAVTLIGWACLADALLSFLALRPAWWLICNIAWALWYIGKSAVELVVWLVRLLAAWVDAKQQARPSFPVAHRAGG